MGRERCYERIVKGGGLNSPALKNSMIAQIATTILGDEKAMGLLEKHEQSPGSRGFRRYQCISVVRNGKLAEYREDMGSAKKYKGINPIYIPSFFEHSVDELKDMADYLRGEVHIDIKDFLELNNYKV